MTAQIISIATPEAKLRARLNAVTTRAGLTAWERLLRDEQGTLSPDAFVSMVGLAVGKFLDLRQAA